MCKGCFHVLRDLKPENVMLDREGHLKIIDFGLSRDNVSDLDVMPMTFCGTKEYMAPEVFARRPYGKAADWWAVGAIGYDMLAGEFPYKMGDYATEIKFPNNVFSRAGKTLLKKFLTVDPNKRLGSPAFGGATKIKRAAFFKDLSWSKVYMRHVKPPYVPRLSGPVDTSCFDREFVDLPARLSAVSAEEDERHKGDKTDQELFGDFEYVNEKF